MIQEPYKTKTQKRIKLLNKRIKYMKYWAKCVLNKNGGRPRDWYRIMSDVSRCRERKEGLKQLIQFEVGMYVSPIARKSLGRITDIETKTLPCNEVNWEDATERFLLTVYWEDLGSCRSEVNTSLVPVRREDIVYTWNNDCFCRDFDGKELESLSQLAKLLKNKNLSREQKLWIRGQYIYIANATIKPNDFVFQVEDNNPLRVDSISTQKGFPFLHLCNGLNLFPHEVTPCPIALQLSLD